MNQLTEKLLALGYTEHHHPDYVRWHYGYKEFEYTHDYLKKTVWEAPCGLLTNSVAYSSGWGSHLGVDYRPENDNHRAGCPYYDLVPCEHRLDTKLMGWNCIFHRTDKPYDYENSVEKVWEQRDKEQSDAYRALVDSFPKGVSEHCWCWYYDYKIKNYKPRFNVHDCIYYKCKNKVCAVTRKERDLTKVNIFFDVLFTYTLEHDRILADGTISNIEKSYTRGKKVFDRNIAKTDAEIWLKENGDSYFYIADDMDKRNIARKHALDSFGSLTNYTVEFQNICVKTRETRDLLSDLEDIRAGIQVVHASDQKKAVAALKRERKVKRKEARRRKAQKAYIEKCKAALHDPDTSEDMRDFYETQLKKHGVVVLPEAEQLEIIVQI